MNKYGVSKLLLVGIGGTMVMTLTLMNPVSAGQASSQGGKQSHTEKKEQTGRSSSEKGTSAGMMGEETTGGGGPSGTSGGSHVSPHSSGFEEAGSGGKQRGPEMGGSGR